MAMNFSLLVCKLEIALVPYSVYDKLNDGKMLRIGLTHKKSTQ